VKSNTKAIFEEYCKSVLVYEEPVHSVEVVVSGKYFTELYARVMEHGYTCHSLISTEDDTHIAMFSIASSTDFGKLFDDMIGDEFNEDDSADWWKHQD
jgi:hypothetical protein